MNTDSKWRRLLPWLKRTFPARLPVSVRTVPARVIGEFDGDTDLVGKRFIIRINRNRSYALRFDALIHEHAHALTWDNVPEGCDPHVSEWGVAYARIYRTFWAWDFGRAEQAKKKARRFLPGQKNFLNEPED